LIASFGAWYFSVSHELKETQMPFTPDSPQSKDVKGPTVNKTLDTLHIHELRIKLDPNNSDGLAVDVYWTEGYMTDGGTVYNPVVSHHETLQGQDVIDKVNANTGGDSLYDEVKDAVWDLLKDRSLVPAGAVS
jgi:hypothetical protein